MYITVQLATMGTCISDDGKSRVAHNVETFVVKNPFTLRKEVIDKIHKNIYFVWRGYLRPHELARLKGTIDMDKILDGFQGDEKITIDAGKSGKAEIRLTLR